jgi:FixJ family two-component response regulator
MCASKNGGARQQRNKDIAARLGISEYTVKFYISSILDPTGSSGACLEINLEHLRASQTNYPGQRTLSALGVRTTPD